MKTISRPLVALMLLIWLSFPAQAQNPAVRMKAGPPIELITYTLQNLSAAAIFVSTVELRIFDQGTCKQLCVSVSQVNQSIGSCKTLERQIRCSAPPPPAPKGYIYNLRVKRSGVLLSECWLYVP